jgi:predicted dehydrogenase
MDFHARRARAPRRRAGGGRGREASLRSPAERHGIPRITTDWRELVADSEVDAVIIGPPNALHAPQAIACLEAGKHVLVEKPMARTLAEAEAMNMAAAASGRRLMVAHCWRFHDDVRALRRRIAGGELGEITKTRGWRARAGAVGMVHRPGAGRRGALRKASTPSTRCDSCLATPPWRASARA